MSDSWRSEMKERLCAWVDALPEQPSDEGAADDEVVPDLQEVWAAIIAMESHLRKHTQKVAAALQAINERLDSSFTEDAENPLAQPREMVTVMASFAGQLERFAGQLALEPKALLFGRDREWRERWRGLAQSVAILQRQMNALLELHGISQNRPQQGADFDPQWMEVLQVDGVGTTPGKAIVGTVFEPAYFVESACVRPAKISISR